MAADRGVAPLLHQPLVAFVGTTSYARAKGFYAERLGLPVLSEDGFALVLDCLGTNLRVTLVHEVKPAPYTVLGWHVPDIEGTVRGLVDGGVVFERFPGLEQDDLGIWTAPGGTRVCWFRDPDGNLLSLSEGA